jgi:hypothetical protein
MPVGFLFHVVGGGRLFFWSFGDIDLYNVLFVMATFAFGISFYRMCEGNEKIVMQSNA